MTIAASLVQSIANGLRNTAHGLHSVADSLDPSPPYQTNVRSSEGRLPPSTRTGQKESFIAFFDFVMSVVLSVGISILTLNLLARLGTTTSLILFGALLYSYSPKAR